MAEAPFFFHVSDPSLFVWIRIGTKFNLDWYRYLTLNTPFLVRFFQNLIKDYQLDLIKLKNLYIGYAKNIKHTVDGR